MKWQLTSVFLPGKSHGQRSLAGCCPWGHKELGTTEQLNHASRTDLFAHAWFWHILAIWKIWVQLINQIFWMLTYFIWWYFKIIFMYIFTANIIQISSEVLGICQAPEVDMCFLGPQFSLENLNFILGNKYYQLFSLKLQDDFNWS